jgi:hypothetical protein
MKSDTKIKPKAEAPLEPSPELLEVIRRKNWRVRVEPPLKPSPALRETIARKGWRT